MRGREETRAWADPHGYPSDDRYPAGERGTGAYHGEEELEPILAAQLRLRRSQIQIRGSKARRVEREDAHLSGAAALGQQPRSDEMRRAVISEQLAGVGVA